MSTCNPWKFWSSEMVKKSVLIKGPLWTEPGQYFSCGILSPGNTYPNQFLALPLMLMFMTPLRWLDDGKLNSRRRLRKWQVKHFDLPFIFPNSQLDEKSLDIWSDIWYFSFGNLLPRTHLLHQINLWFFYWFFLFLNGNWMMQTLFKEEI